MTDKLLQVFFDSQNILQQLDLYENERRANASSEGSLCDNLFEEKITKKLQSSRKQLFFSLIALTEENIIKLPQIDTLFQSIERLRGSLYDYELSIQEQEEILKLNHSLSEEKTQPYNKLISYFALSLYKQPFELILPNFLELLSTPHFSRLMQVLLRQPHLMTEAHEALYVDHYKRLCIWLLGLIKKSDPWTKANKDSLFHTIKSKLTFGACYYVDKPILPIIKLRAQIIQECITHSGEEKLYKDSFYKKDRNKNDKIKLGILSRNLGDYTDTQALYALFHAFDQDKYEIYWYSLDVQDPTTQSNVLFFRKLFNLIHKTISLRGNTTQMAQTILSDDLDIFAVGTGYNSGCKDIDRLLFHKLGRIQLALSELVPGSSGSKSYDYLLCPNSPADSMEVYKSEATEKLLPIDGPVLWYRKKEKVSPKNNLSRRSLSIPDDATVFCSGAAANKQMAGTLRTFIEILQKVDNSYLLLYPFNPAWGGYYIGLTFLSRLRNVLKQYPDIDPQRIIIARQVNPQDGDRLIQLSDIYLGSFPRGGATSTMLALRYNKPVIARKETWIHSHDDAVMLRSINCEELIAKSNKDFVEIASKLALNKKVYQKIINKINYEIEKAPFFNIEKNSKTFQKYFDELALNHNLLKDK